MGESGKTAVSDGLACCDCPPVGVLTARRIATVFVLYGLFATAFLSVNIPPFQNPDEHAHFLRAAQLADGGLVGTRFSSIGADGKSDISAGGPSDPAILKASEPFNALIFHPDKRAAFTDWAPRVHWSNSRVMEKFPNTVMNPPFFYAPSALGVWVGRLTRMTVIQTLMVSRALTAVAAIAIGAVAIVVAGGAAPWIFAVLTLPMSLSLTASSSQDALMLACGALAGSLMVRVLRYPNKRNVRALAGITITLSLVAMARPPYGALALLPFALLNVRWQWRLVSAAVVLGCVLAWSGVNAVTSMTNFGGFVGADPALQASLLRQNPLLVAQVGWETISVHWHSYLEGFVGRLGWLDTALPKWYRNLALAVLGIAAIAGSLGLRRGPALRGSRVIVSAALLISAAGLFAAMYVSWTVPGSATVEGVQGRYFLPLAVAGAALLPTLGDARWAWLHKSLVGAVMAFPLVSLTVVMRTIVLRYYLG